MVLQFTSRNLQLCSRGASPLHVGKALNGEAPEWGALGICVSTKKLVWLNLTSSPSMFWFEQGILRIVRILQIEMPVIWRGGLG